MSGEPNTARAGVVLSSSLAVEWRPSRIHGKWSGHLAEAQRARSMSLRQRWKHSTHHPFGLRMVCCRLGSGMLDVKQVAQGGPQGGGELGSAVLCDDCWDPKSALPFLKQSICAVDCRREILSMIVNRWVKLFNNGRGPTRFMWM